MSREPTEWHVQIKCEACTSVWFSQWDPLDQTCSVCGDAGVLVHEVRWWPVPWWKFWVTIRPYETRPLRRASDDTPGIRFVRTGASS